MDAFASIVQQSIHVSKEAVLVASRDKNSAVGSRSYEAKADESNQACKATNFQDSPHAKCVTVRLGQYAYVSREISNPADFSPVVTIRP
jgi:hypothetical protein